MRNIAHLGRGEPAPARSAPEPEPDTGRTHEQMASGEVPTRAPRPEIGDSWERLRRLGLDPERGREPEHLGPAEVEHRRRSSGLDAVMPALRSALLDPVSDLPLILAVADSSGTLLWHEGPRQLRRSGDLIGFMTGGHWGEDAVGTNGIGTVARTGRPMRVHSTEHYMLNQHAWTCVGAPVRDPRTGRVAGVVDLSGPARGVHPQLLALAVTAAKLAETELRAAQLESLHRLRTVAEPVLAQATGPALVVDRDGWTAAAAGLLTPVNRLRLPADGWGAAPVHWLPSLGHCAVEPLADGWLVRPLTDCRQAVSEQAAGARLVLDLSSADHPVVSVRGGAGNWSHPLSPRHAELLLLLATHQPGRTAAQLADGLFGDPSRTVTVRAELSRLRRYLGGLLEHRPYRFAESVQVEVVRPQDAYQLLPASSAPGIRRLRALLDSGSVMLPGCRTTDRPQPLPGAIPCPRQADDAPQPI
ncbi:helix-turn-helix domain-containing protein [Kitasatospora viridis]|uniref:GAF domain-containing protein n=1 Tax=Kitasatospora viridis TaxID=281105 RepID=A0A561UDI0_9ACTN|nr:helix-turn-helix domain-containing protein [Kitasatospora viridis]TWF97385.1 GAF domain-containing protein [Kitasatospora viridis]